MTEPCVVSSFFSEPKTNKHSSTIAEDFLFYIDELNQQLDDFKTPASVQCVYNPTKYARECFETYVKKYCNTKKRIMYFGMNPGPWGMSQTGVPFGEISSVRDWLGIKGSVGKPPLEIKSRPVNGFDCKRTEVSGKRFWGLFKNLCGEPNNFFESSFVYNYLPEQWMKNNGCNLTPGDFKVIYMPHPSPRAVNNNNWDDKALHCLKQNNLLHFYQGFA
ncbi:single-strand selective monofunctional uracil DNA glycosylase isoform X2 [Bombyx mandarina]|uniref:Single-strand selective monofunctional uracil DNA glycosylase isoform X2 n=1 Tax=Bombyx mandarina TaxID=7092 RepID=A0A6J2KAH5_BOMMA|nr:single-strand selective monofunctional uracil DNA glycosylase isoform X2 [Bombyx mandarina]